MAETSLGNAVLKLTADDKGLTKNLLSAKQKVQKAGADMVKVGAGLAAFGAASAVAFGSAIKSASDFQLGITNITNLLGSEGLKSTQMFSDGIKDISVQFGQTKESLTASLFDIVSAGTDLSDSMEFLAASAELANAGLTSTNITTSALLTTMAAFEDSVTSAADASDFLFSVQKFGRTTLEEVASSLGKLAPMASLAGLSLEDMGAAIATVTLSGISTKEVMTSLQALMKTFIDPTEDAIEAASELGFELNANALQGDNFARTLKKISKGSIEQINAISGSVEAFKALAPIVTDVSKFEEIRLGIQERSGVVTSAANEINKTFSKQMDILRETIGSLVLTIGETLIPAVQSVVEFMKPAVETVISFAENNPVLTRTITLLAAGLGAVALIIGPLLIAFGLLIPAIAAISVPTLAVVGAIGLFIGALALFATRIGDFVNLGKELWRSFKEDAETAWRKIRNFFDDQATKISGFFEDAWDDIASFFTDAFKDIKRAVKTWIRGLETKFENVATAIEDTFDLLWGTVKGIFTTQFDFIKGIVTAFISLVKGDFTGFKDKLIATFTELWDKVKAVFTGAFTAIKAKVTGFTDAVKGAFSTLSFGLIGGSIITDMMRDIGLEFGKLQTKMVDPTVFATNTTAGAFSSITSSITGPGGLSSALAGLLTGQNSFDSIARKVKDFGLTIVNDLINKALKPLSSALDGLLSKLGRVFGGTGGSGSSGGGGGGGGIGGGGGSSGTMVPGLREAEAVSNIIDNTIRLFGSREEGSLNVIEMNTRFSSIHLLHLLEKANDTWPNMEFTKDAVWATRGVLVNPIAPLLTDIRDGLDSLLDATRERDRQPIEVTVKLDGKTLDKRTVDGIRLNRSGLRTAISGV